MSVIVTLALDGPTGRTNSSGVSARAWIHSLGNFRKALRDDAHLIFAWFEHQGELAISIRDCGRGGQSSSGGPNVGAWDGGAIWIDHLAAQ